MHTKPVQTEQEVPEAGSVRCRRDRVDRRKENSHATGKGLCYNDIIMTSRIMTSISHAKGQGLCCYDVKWHYVTRCQTLMLQAKFVLQ